MLDWWSVVLVGRDGQMGDGYAGQECQNEPLGLSGDGGGGVDDAH